MRVTRVLREFTRVEHIAHNASALSYILTLMLEPCGILDLRLTSVRRAPRGNAWKQKKLKRKCIIFVGIYRQKEQFCRAVSIPQRTLK